MQRLASWYHAFVGAVQQVYAWFWAQAVSRSPGQGLTEYGLVLVLIMVVCVVIIGMTGRTISQTWYDRLINNPAWSS
ncbi:MAG: hypothetical protein MUD01_11850 [Chloroflexaceae bacterium]|jgi:hypothetical protein|nr:hypothetical protein [Chloroflexaceae bacterium]